MSREDLERKVQSKSIPKQPASPYLKRNEFHSADKCEIKLTKKKLEEKCFVEKVLEKLAANEQYEWKFVSFEEKRSISGFKARLQWLSKTRGFKAIFKFSFASCIFNQTGAIFQGDIIIELYNLSEKREMQDKIDLILSLSLQASKKRGFADQMGRQSQYLRSILFQLGQFLQKFSAARRKIANEKIDKKLLSYRQILYPAPATFTWNPLGNICITQNKFPTIKRPLIGQPSALKKYLQAFRQQNSSNGIEGQSDEVQLSSQKEGISSLFNWHIEQQIKLLIFSHQNSKTEDYFTSRNRNSDIEAQQKKEEQKGGQDSIDLGSLSVLPPKLRKAYQRYFGGQRPGQLHHHDKLKVYDILSLSRQDQDDIVYLIDRITTRPADTSVSEIAFQNYLTAYPLILNGNVDRFRYHIIANQLKQAIANPSLAFGAYLRAFVLENQFFSREIQRYFREQYRMLRMMAHQELYGLGNYSKFDSPRAELIFMDLLNRFLQRNDQRQLKRCRIEGIKITRKTRLCRFNVEGVVGQQCKSQFLTGLFPLLIVKDRQMERFQFKKVKKIVAANAKITAFIKKMNEIVIKYQQGKTSFLKHVVQQYSRFKQNFQDNTMEPKRLFISWCRDCNKRVEYLSLPSYEQVSQCFNCKSKLFREIIQ